MDKEKARKGKKQVKSLVEEAFKYYDKDVLFEKQFIKYYRDRGMSKDEIDRLWVKAHNMKILRIGAKPVYREKPYRILGNVMVFRLLGKEGV